MLETLDLTSRIELAAYEEMKQKLNVELNRVQNEARDLGLPVIVVFEGWDFSGKGQCARFLTQPLDPRWQKLFVMYPPDRHERQFPFQRRYWLRLPARGQIAIFLRSWYYHVLDESIHANHNGSIQTRLVLEQIRNFERMLADDGTLIVKFWLHIDRKEQRRRREKSSEGKVRRWRRGPDDPKQHKRFHEYTHAVEEMLAATSTDYGRWYPLPATDKRFARIAVATHLVNRISDAVVLRRRAASATSESIPFANNSLPAPGFGTPLLASVDLAKKLDDDSYKSEIVKLQKELVELHYQCVDQKRPVIIALEGWDAAGKGGAIRRLTSELDPRYLNVHSISAPQGDEATHHYLWRFWKRVPPRGNWAIFDRTWYGRVLVERVEQFASIEEWRRAYTEINDFESALLRSGQILIKFWLHISPEEQLARFQARQNVEYKHYKITEDDWRNREKWPLYEKCVNDMIQRTSTSAAPWTIVPANCKNYARVLILRTCVAAIAKGLKGD